ncbi:NAD-dependent epimerase/dehydratase family protein [Pararobbsia silviterrae]|uniref:NAD-dependent epimerase/dehydratase family protein n=1 Tax=Pararobbsia silviterrae TaxID=1792498 RepID=A0A494XWC3_9BURK|nr:NAD-dependent epimerase/dehydratase family protein [Pararobbsia silviterrae]RKP51893.1 NAD-dependent epimerase/dehydratase family protein [Pararobbsia silviterrae]
MHTSDIKTVFVTGITGYIGGTIAVRLKQRGYAVVGLARTDADIARLAERGFESIQGTLQDDRALETAIASSDAVIHTADSDDPAVVDTFVSLLKGTGKTFIYTSGSAIVANWDRPDTADFVYTEEFPVDTGTLMGQRVLINNAVQRAALLNVRSIVIVPSMVYGAGLLLNTHSKQLPELFRTAKARGAAVYVGSGAHCWSNVHVEDLADLYVAALEKARPGTTFFAENGIASFKAIADAIHATLGLDGQAQSLSAAQAAECWGEMMANIAFGSNCRLSADKARAVLGWTPVHTNVLDAIRTMR